MTSLVASAIARSSFFAAMLALAFLICVFGASAALGPNTFATPTSISGSGSIAGTNVGAVGEVGEPAPFGAVNTIWYRYVASGPGTLVFETCSATATNFDTSITAYTAPALPTVATFANITSPNGNDDTGGCATTASTGLGSRVTQTVVSGGIYYMQVDGWDANTGNFLLQYAFTPTPVNLLVTKTDGSTAEAGGDTGLFGVSLSSVPTSNVTVTIAVDPTGQCTFAPSVLTFTTANWNVVQTVTATAVNDFVAEGAHTCGTGTITAAGGGYAGRTAPAQTFTVTDNDIAAITVTNTTPTATEGGANGAFTVVLTSQPTANVTVTIGTGAQCTFLPSPLTFTAANWNLAQTVTTTAINDVIVEGTHSCTSGAILASGAGSGYVGLTGTASTFAITDNDVGALTVVNTIATATEGGATGAFTVVLTAQPAANVTVTIATGAQCTFLPSPLTFTNGNWNTAQTVTTTAINDVIVEGAHTCTTGAISASGSGYTGVTGTAPTFAITDNDVGALTIVNTIATATEGGANGAFTVVLTAQPAANVIVTIATGAQCTFLPSPLTFTNGNWNTAQTVTTTAINDVIVEGAHSCTTGIISASGSGYTGVTGTAPTFAITDNDVGALTIVNTIATATEGGATGAFTVVLTAQPAANVTVTIATGAQCTFLPSPLTFTNANWNTAQTVTTTAINDVIVEGAHSCTTGIISASGSGYTGVTGTAPTFAITDNDVGAITVVNTIATATEGGATGAFTVVLTAQPAANVTVTIATGAQCTFAPSPLTFTNANWNTAQTVTTTAINDVIVEGAHSCTTGIISASGSGYTGVTGTAPTFAITDNDVGAITVVNTIATATEGGATGAFTVVLTAQPAANVTVTIATGAQCTFAPSPLTFTNANWNTAQTVTTTAINDVIVEGAHSCTTGVISASGSGYTGVTGTAPTFAITDNDVGAITVVNTIATATEGGANGAFTVVLTAQPAANVTVTIATGAQCTFLPSPLTFTNANWNTAQTVTTTAINDVIVEGAHSCTTGAISASGSGYTGVTGTAPTFAITDNDVASILVEKTASTTSVTIAGALITYSIKITNTGNVIANGVTVTDTLAAAICPTSGTNTIAALAPAGFETCTASYTATQTDFDSNGGGDGDIDNIASASGTAGGVAVAGNDAVAVLCTPVSAMTIVKSADKTGPLNVGDIITYSFLAKNTGNVTLSDVSIQETAFNGSTPPLGTPLLETLTDNLPLNTLSQQSTDVAANNGVWSVLKPNDEVSFQLTYTVLQSDVDLLQ